MCGIGGYIGGSGRAPGGSGLDEASILSQLAHRGPDHRGQVHLRTAGGAPVFLGFTRLAIIDLSPAGHQPMSTEDGALTLVYNGEVYNFRALRHELLAAGHRFRSTSDTEVVLRGYRQWGLGVLERLRGMFAFALWDAERQELHLCRDRLGIKPLYYTHDGERLSFGSELRTLLAGGAARPRLCPQAVHGYLSLGSVPQPRTILRDVSLLLPGHSMTVRVDGTRARAAAPRRYFALPPPAMAGGSQERAVASVAEILQEAVSLRLIADVPVGVLLSGGIDSTAVAALSHRAAQDLDTFTLTYGADHDQSEGREASEVARALGILQAGRHHERVETPASVLAQVPGFLAAIDQPSVDGLNTYLVAELVRAAGLKVALSGLGGDEVFLGYRLPRVFASLYRLGEQAGRLAAAPGLAALSSLLRHSALGRAPLLVQKGAVTLDTLTASSDPQRLACGLYALLRGLFPGPQLARLWDRGSAGEAPDPADHVRFAPPIPTAGKDLDPVALVSYLEIDNYLSNTLLRDADVMSMTHGVELRVPLCDHVLVSHVLGLGTAARAGSGARDRRRKKPLLVDACQSPLVRGAAERPKRGFVLPLEAFLLRDLRAQVQQVLEDADAARAAGLVPAAVSRLWRAFIDGRARGATWRVWALFILLSWVRRHGAGL
jgi:asparagine synthase (glutamine-hydrolysing)